MVSLAVDISQPSAAILDNATEAEVAAELTVIEDNVENGEREEGKGERRGWWLANARAQSA